MDLIGALVIGIMFGALVDVYLGFSWDLGPGSIVVAMLIGIAGSLVANGLGQAFGWYSHQLSGPSIVTSVVGAATLLTVYGLMTRRRKW